MLGTIGRRARVALAVIAMSVLAACGGGGGGDSPAPAAATLALAADASTVVWNAAATIDVAANDSASSGTLSLVSVTAPAHGTASISNGRIVYTPTAGYFGPDSFGYTARAENGGAAATAQVNVTVEAQLSITGTAKDAPLPGAAITVTLGGRTFTATADANGGFEVTVRSAAASDFVRIDAVGSGGTASLRTLVGEFGALVSAAGNGGRLGSASFPRLDATHHSTAHAALALAANGGTLPTTAAQLEAALAKVSPSDALDMAALIQRVVDGGVPLPAGKADVWALVSDAAAYRSFFEATVAADPTAFAGARDAAAASQPVAAPPIAAELAGREIAYYGTGFGPDIAYLARYNADGSVQLRGDFGTRVGTWQRSGDAITIDYAQPVVFTSISDPDPQTGDQFTVLVSQPQLVLRRDAFAPTGWRATVVSTQTFTDGPRIGQQVPLTTADSPGFAVRAADLSARLPVAASEFGEGRRWAGFQKRTVAPNGLPPIPVVEQDAFVMTTGVTAASLVDPTTTYAVAVADNRVSITRTTLGTPFPANDYVRLAVDPDGSERWLAMEPTTNGSGAVASLPVRTFTGATLDIGSASHRWQGFSDSTRALRQDLFADGTGFQVSTDIGFPPSSVAVTWQLQPGFLEIRRSLSGGRRERVRQWFPLAKDDAGLWVLETITDGVPGDPLSIQLATSRVVRLVDLGPATP